MGACRNPVTGGIFSLGPPSPISLQLPFRYFLWEWYGSSIPGDFPLKQCFGRTQCVGNICIYLERERVFIYIPWDFHRLLLIYVYIFSAPHVNTLSTQQLFHLIRKNSSLDIFHPVELPIVKRLSNITGISKQLRLDVVKRLKFNFISLPNNPCMVYFTYIYHKK